MFCFCLPGQVAGGWKELALFVLLCIIPREWRPELGDVLVFSVGVLTGHVLCLNWEECYPAHALMSTPETDPRKAWG